MLFVVYSQLPKPWFSILKSELQPSSYRKKKHQIPWISACDKRGKKTLRLLPRVNARCIVLSWPDLQTTAGSNEASSKSGNLFLLLSNHDTFIIKRITFIFPVFPECTAQLGESSQPALMVLFVAALIIYFINAAIVMLHVYSWTKTKRVNRLTDFFDFDDTFNTWTLKINAPLCVLLRLLLL